MTDIHGEYVGMERLLKHVGFNPAVDHIVFGGDMIDRGNDSGKVVKRIKLLCEQYPENVRAIIGNHEEMFLWYMHSRSGMWLIHGGLECIQSFNEVFNRDNQLIQEHADWIESLPLFVEDDTFVYAHAGLDPYEPLNKQSREVLWMTESELYRYHKPDVFALTNGKPIVHGHTPVERIYFDDVRINGDLGCSTYSILEERGLALLDLTHMEYYVYKTFTKQIEQRKIITF